MIYITAPAKEKGHVFLKINKEMWNWIPSINRMIKLPPSMMMQNWMGSDFTNDYLVNQSSIITDFEHKLMKENIIREQLYYKIELMAKEEAAVVWEKIIMWITKDGLNIWKTEYYDEDEYLVNVENAFNLKKMGDRIIPTRIEIITVDKKNQKTILEINDIVFNAPIKDNFFSQQNMKRIR